MRRNIMSYTNKPKYLITDEANIQAITLVANQDWFQILGHLVDETSDVDVNYTQLLLWQIYNSSKQSVMSFSLNAQYYKDAYEQTFVNERQAPDGTEISTINADNLLSQGKTWKALEDKYTAIHNACAELYKQLYQMEWHQRKVAKPSQGKMRTMSQMTPDEIAEAKRLSKEAFGY